MFLGYFSRVRYCCSKAWPMTFLIKLVEEVGIMHLVQCAGHQFLCALASVPLGPGVNKALSRYGEQKVPIGQKTV